MNKFKNIIEKKPAFFVITSIVYLLVTAVINWKLNIRPETFLYFAGGLLGIYFLDIAEEFFSLKPSPFRSVIFCAAFFAVSMFVVTSSNAYFAVGLVLSMYLNLVLRQTGEWKLSGHLNDWYSMLAEPVKNRTQLYILILFILFFILESVIFIR